MQAGTATIGIFEEYLKKKELELSLIKSQSYDENSESYSVTPLLGFSKRIREFDIVRDDTNKVRGMIRRNEKTIYACAICILVVFTVSITI